MSELAVPESGTQLAPYGEQPSALVRWAQEAMQAADIASKLAMTSFVPQSLRGKPADVTAAILAGQELGLQPMATLRSMDVIQGTPALRAHAMRGLVQSRGHEIELVESTPVLCVMRGRRAGATAWQEVRWPVERAAQMGLVQKAEWKKQPQTMLVARATGELCRLIASDVLFAMPFAAEELRTMDNPALEAGGSSDLVTLEEITQNAPKPVGGPTDAWAPDPVWGQEQPEPPFEESGEWAGAAPVFPDGKRPVETVAAVWPEARKPGSGGAE